VESTSGKFGALRKTVLERGKIMAGIMSADKRQITIRLDRETYRSAEKKASSMGMTMLDYVRSLVYRDTEDVVLTVQDLEQIIVEKKAYQKKIASLK